MWKYRNFLPVLALLFTAQADAAVARGATTSSCVTTALSQTSCNITHTVDSGTTLLILVVNIEALESVDATPTWNTSENFTLLNGTTAGPGNQDVRNYVYYLENPTVKSDTITVSVTTTDNISAFAINYSGTTTPVSLNEDVNNQTAETSTTVLSSGGASTSALLAVGVRKGGETSTCASNGSSFTEIFDGATDEFDLVDHCYYVAELITGAPSGVTITWVGPDSNAGQLIEIKASSAGTDSVLFFTR